MATPRRQAQRAQKMALTMTHELRRQPTPADWTPTMRAAWSAALLATLAWLLAR